MKRLLMWLPCLFVALGVVWFSAEPAGAINDFKKQFESKYVKEDSSEPNDVSLREAVAAARCYVCHVKGESKSVRNAYGNALSALLDKRADKDNIEKIQAALDEVAAQRPAPEGPTFGELIASGKLPGGESGE